jgi:cytosine/adenosine deaminase-related metal-dependent hydrolase
MYADVDVKKAINMGLIPGPRLWVSTRGLNTLGRYMPDNYSWELDLPKGVQMVTGTSVAAELLGQSPEIGHLAPGMLADIVAVPGDPL